jgi:hypothetical protein
MDPGAGGGPPTSTARLAAELPQPFKAVTVTIPPAGPAVTVMEFVAEAPVQPSGSVQV